MNMLSPEWGLPEVAGGFGVHREQGPKARALATATPTVISDTLNADVLQIFSQHRHLVSLPVLEAGRPIGLISRHIFMSQMSKPYYRELYEKKSCIAFMDKEPLIVEANTPIETLAVLAVDSGDKALAEGFLVTEQGHYLGLGSGLSLMRTLVDLQTDKNRQIMQSIDYASAIQRAMLDVSRQSIGATLGEHAALQWEPRDLVGGDFYHFYAYPDGWFLAMADCTGHGVPGAFLTLIASSCLGHALERYGPRDPARLLAKVSQGLKAALGQHEWHEQTDRLWTGDGMDAAFLWFDAKSRQLTSAHARMPILLLSPDAHAVDLQDGDRVGLGYVDTPDDMVWRNHVRYLSPATLLCCFTDGLVDQVGGDRRIGYGKKRLRSLLLQHRQTGMAQLLEAVLQDHRRYQGQERRRDDMTLFVLRLNP